MKKYICLFGVLCIMFCLSSCSLFSDNSLKENQLTDEKQQIIVEALANKDEDIIKNVLSEKALSSSDLQKGIDYCFDLFDGNIVNIEKKGCPVLDYFDSGKHTKKIEANYLITSDTGRIYNLYFELWIKQDIEPKRLGVDKIKLCDYNEAVNDPNYVKASSYERSGIYNPEWDEAYHANPEKWDY